MKTRDLLKSAGQFLIVILVVSSVPFLASAGPIAANPNAKQKLKPEIAEKLALCNGNQLKPSVTNPSCTGWWLSQITEAPNIPDERPFYLGQYGDACTTGSDDVLRCFFRFPVHACKAWTEARNLDPNLSSDFKKVCGCGAHPTDSQGNAVTDLYNCAWCEKGEEGCSGSGTQYFNTLKCAGNQHTISLQVIPPEAYHDYCYYEVSGPYSQYANKYKVCGTEHTQTYPGMIFTIERRTQTIFKS